MTVALGLVCSDGVVVASDSKATSGDTARTVCKVYAEPDLCLVWTASGSLFVIEEVQAVLSGAAAAASGRERALCREPNLNGIREKLGDGLVRAAMKRSYEGALPFGLNQQLNGHHPFISDFLLLGWSRGTPWFLEIARDGQMNWHTSAGFAAVGSGGPFASVAQAMVQHYLEREPLNVQDGLLVAYRAIHTTCEVSSQFVGLPVWLATATDDGARVLDRAEVDEVATAVERWKQLERETLGGAPLDDEPEQLPTLDEEPQESHITE